MVSIPNKKLRLFLKDADDFVKELFKAKLPGAFTYHNYTHTLYVKDAALKIAERMKLDSDDLFCLELACLFHDTGNIHGRKSHEENSVKIAKDWLNTQGIPSTIVNKISTIILATKIEHVPENELENIIRDADLSHLGSEDFFSFSQLLKIETENLGNKKIDANDWLRMNLEFLRNHEYLTDAARDLYEKQKQANIVLLQSKLQEKSTAF